MHINAASVMKRNESAVKILFISLNGIQDSEFGGPKGSIRNYKALQTFGSIDVYTIKKESTLKSALSLLSGLFPPISRNNLKELRDLANNRYDMVFFDGSVYGDLIDLFSDSKKTVFYHNCEHDYNMVRFGAGFSLKKSIYQKLVDRNERIITEKSDYRIVFSKRDAGRIEELYSVEVDGVAPLGIDDKYTGVIPSEDQACCLLLGSVCTANLDGYRWFAKNVSPYLNCKTVIAGKGFENYKSELSSDKVEIVGYVQDLERRYADSACVAIPLFLGGGMKVKTVEALMFGKTVFGTSEAFSGFKYDMDGCSCICNTADEFIEGINRYINSCKPWFNEKSRKIYEEKYSLKSTFGVFRKMMADLGLEEGS